MEGCSRALLGWSCVTSERTIAARLDIERKYYIALESQKTLQVN